MRENIELPWIMVAHGMLMWEWRKRQRNFNILYVKSENGNGKHTNINA